MTSDTPRHQLAITHEAHPLSETELTESEKQALEEVDAWLKAALDDAAVVTSADERLLGRRSGRVLFIGGGRGSGKTSILLTILQRWRSVGSASGKYVGMPVEVLLPILDFDPLPVDMPIQAWLLEPWRRLAKKLDDSNVRSGDRDLTERFANLFDRVIAGWTSTLAEGRDLLDQSLALSEKTQGWLDTQDEWTSFVDELLVITAKAERAKPKPIYVVAIDDVDLQVEQIPSLLHALRLFHHPRVAYVLTGDFGHLSDVVELDFLHRHARVAGRRDTYHDRHESLIHDHSRRLAKALLEKVIPSQVRIELRLLTLAQVLNLCGDKKSEIVETLPGALKAAVARDDGWPAQLEFVTARHSQQAVDRLRTSPQNGDRSWYAAFVANLCQTTARLAGPPGIDISGELRTVRGPVQKRWSGDGLDIEVYQKVEFEFDPDYVKERRKRGGGAGLVAMLFSEASGVETPLMSWRFGAGVIATLVYWRPGDPEVEGTAVFHWPIATPPTVPEAFALSDFALKLVDSAFDAQNAGALPLSILESFLRENVKWWCRERCASSKGHSGVDPSCGGEDGLLASLKAMYVLDKFEIDRWLTELRVMASPLYGLSEEGASYLVELVKNVRGAPVDPAEFQKTLLSLAKTAILDESELTPGSDKLDRLAQEFLAQRKKRSPDSKRWIVKDQPDGGG